MKNRMNICHVDLRHAQTTKTTTNKTKTIQDYLCGIVYKNKHAHANWGEFVWNEGGVVPATFYLHLISQCVIFIFLHMSESY